MKQELSALLICVSFYSLANKLNCNLKIDQFLGISRVAYPMKDLSVVAIVPFLEYRLSLGSYQIICAYSVMLMASTSEMSETHICKVYVLPFILLSFKLFDSEELYNQAAA